MKIVVLDGYTENPGDLSWEALANLGELTVYDRTPIDDEGEICRRIANCEAVYTNKTPISSATMTACPSLKFIGVLATEYAVVDVKAATEKGIIVANIPEYATETMAQFTIAMLLEICHHVGHHDTAVHEGCWGRDADWCFWDYPLIELARKTMGIIGLGRIGQATARIATALGMRVIAYDKFPSETGKQVASYVDFDELLRQADVIALHCPLLTETRGIINKATISKMKADVIVLNNSQSQLINEYDLAEALNSGKVYGAGLDVMSTEPIQENNPLLWAKNCIITPHISWASRESRQRLMDVAVDNLKQYQLGQPLNVLSQE